MNIIIYSTPTCPYCQQVKEFLDQNKIKYKDIDVSTDEKAAKEMIEKSKQMGVPVIDIDGQIIIGFDEKKLRKILKIKS